LILTQKKEVVRKLIRSLNNNEGILILGSSENLINLVDNYVMREYGLARYYEFTPSVTFFKRN